LPAGFGGKLKLVEGLKLEEVTRRPESAVSCSVQGAVHWKRRRRCRLQSNGVRRRVG
jgi:hypothetical protein